MEGERFEIINPNSNEQSFVVFPNEEEVINFVYFHADPNFLGCSQKNSNFLTNFI